MATTTGLCCRIVCAQPAMSEASASAPRTFQSITFTFVSSGATVAEGGDGLVVVPATDVVVTILVLPRQLSQITWSG